jgi:hypothetical protein
MLIETSTTTPQEVATEQPHSLMGPDSHLPFPIAAALLTFLITASAACNLPEIVPFIAAAGTATTIALTTESAIWSRNKIIFRRNQTRA